MKLLFIVLLFVGCGQDAKKHPQEAPNSDSQQEEAKEDDSFVLVPVNDNQYLPFSKLVAMKDISLGEHFIHNGKLVKGGEETKQGVLCIVSAMKDTEKGESVKVTAVTNRDGFGEGNTGIYFSYLSRDQRKVFVDYCVKFGSEKFTLKDLMAGVGEYFSVH